MHIAFLCSSLEPGRDGVGDYTRRLAAECIRQGHECRLVALNDKGHAKAESGKAENRKEEQLSAFREIQQSEGTDVECLRLPASLGWPERAELAREWLDDFKPDWVSLQFVPFGFHPKGLCFGLGKRLAAINSKAPWHVMFHELWVGLGGNSPFKHRLWGALQRLLVINLVKRLRPKTVQTQAGPYRAVLAQIGVEASLLPLVSNIPFIKGDGWVDLLQPMITEKMERSPDRSELYLAGIFGAVHAEWEAEQAVKVVLPLVKRFRKRLVLVFFGKSNLPPGVFSQLKAQLQNRAEVVLAGERPAAEISKIMQTLDLGLATSPFQLIQKSGSVAAMLEHGLPVLVTRDDWRLPGADTQPEAVSSRLLSPKQFASLDTLPVRDCQPVGEHGVERAAIRLLKAIKLPAINLSSIIKS